MEGLPLGRTAALMPEFAVKDLPLCRTHNNDDKQGVPKLDRQTLGLDR